MTVVSSAMREEAQRLGLHPPSIQVQPMGADFVSRFVSNRVLSAMRMNFCLSAASCQRKGCNTYLMPCPCSLPCVRGCV